VATRKTTPKKAAPRKAAARKPAAKEAATKKAGAAEKAGAEKSGAPRLHVRMYRQGLGDCFLIALPAASGKPFYMLIDCGVVLGTSDPTTQMKRVLLDIIDETKGQIDLLVATHEHWDHVSGFVQVQDLFDKLTIKEVWLAWTEDPKDKLASKLSSERRTAENALRMAVNRLALSGATETAQHVDSLVGFFGAKAGSTEDALNYAKKCAGNNLRFCEPGEPPIEILELPGIRFWVLGPPRDEKLIKKSNPGKNDAYGLDAGPGGSQAFLVSALTRGMGAAAMDAAVPQDDRIEEPFDPRYAIPLARAEHVPFFAGRYYGDSTESGSYDKSAGSEIRDQSWRRIDSTWMEASETMALQLDSATNNTSLVLAMEIIGTGEILLFPGDAQAGNWLSWQDLKWELKDSKSGEKTEVTGPELLARTIFYKVGHHGSHNATLKAKGLELMVNDNLVAMIPVDHDMAVKKRWGLMPLPDLVDRIKEKTQGRVLRIDDKVKTAADLDKLKPENADAEEWKQFADRVDVTDLYYELAF
jgi:hypothetical protein